MRPLHRLSATLSMLSHLECFGSADLGDGAMARGVALCQCSDIESSACAVWQRSEETEVLLQKPEACLWVAGSWDWPLHSC